MNKQKVSLLDCTLRDGSYVINYQFSTEDSFIFAKALSKTGIEWIEVGHGLGLDAQNHGKGNASATDLGYVQAALDAVQGHSKVGVFYIPGIGQIDSIIEMARAGMDFIRIGTNCNEFKQGQKAIEIAKNLGLHVSANLMKSYILTPQEFANNCAKLEAMGVDRVCLVDSAGGMVPSSVKSYVEEAKSKISIELGFHGHNNIHLGVANCLAAVEGGAESIDCSLRGMGRSAGNPATEILAGLLDREGYDLGGIQSQRLMELAEFLVAPNLPRDTGLKIDELASGLTFFHSGYQELISKASKAHNLADYQTILALGKKGWSHVTEEMAQDAAKKAATNKGKFTLQSNYPASSKRWKAQQPTTISELLDTMIQVSAKTDFPGVLTVARSRKETGKSIRIAPVRAGGGYTVGHIESKDIQSDKIIFESLNPMPPRLMIDQLINIPSEVYKSSDVLAYDDDLLILQGLSDFIRVQQTINSFYLPTHTAHFNEIILKNLSFYAQPNDNQADLGIAFFSDRKFNLHDVNRIKPGGLLVIAQPSSVEGEALDLARKKEIKLYRLDLSEALISEVQRLFNGKERIQKEAGQINVDGLTLVAGGVLGVKGSLVLDSLRKPRMIFGVADGYGSVEQFSKLDKATQSKVLEWILGQMDF